MSQIAFADATNARIHRELLAMAEAIVHLDEAACLVTGTEISTFGLRPTIQVRLPARSEFERIAQCTKRATFNGVSHVTMAFDYHGVRVEYQATLRAEQVTA